jgi:hypothetical protein
LWVDSGTFLHYLAAFREGLRAQGYVEGKNIQIEDRFLAKGYEQLSDAAAKLVSEKAIDANGPVFQESSFRSVSHILRHISLHL